MRPSFLLRTRPPYAVQVRRIRASIVRNVRRRSDCTTSAVYFTVRSCAKNRAAEVCPPAVSLRLPLLVYSIAPNIGAFLAQVIRLAGNGYYLYFRGELKPGKDPPKLDAKLIREWQLDRPYWKREKRRRRAAPSIWYLRYKREYLLIATKKASDHRFFEEYESTLKDIRRDAVYFRGHTIRYSISKETGRRRVRLDKPTYEYLRNTFCTKAIRESYRGREVIEADSIPSYRGVGRRLRSILKEANRRRSRCVGFDPARLTCVRKVMRRRRRA